VTAANGTRKLYTVSIQVAKSSNTNLTSVTINGSSVTAGSTFDLLARTTQVTVKAIAADAESTISVSGATSLTAGVNTLRVTVTAPSGAQTVYSYFLNVAALSTNANLASLVVGTTDVLGSLVNGELVSQIVLPVGTTTIPVVAKTAANDATLTFATGSANPANLQPGSNRITFEVVAADGVTKKTFVVTVFVTQRSSNANISTDAGTWTINGIDVANPATVIELPAGTTAVTAKAKTQDSKATLAITGASGLLAGPNKVTFRVTAEDGITVATYERSVTVLTLSSNTKLTSLLVGGTSVQSGATVTLPVGTTRVEVIPTLESKESKFTITGNTGFVNGSSNTVSVTVTAPSGATQVYTVTVVVPGLASNTTLASFVIEGVTVADGQTITLGGAKTSIKIAAKASDLTAAVVITGKSGLVIGNNLVTVTVTAKSGASSVYRVTVIVTN
jgi:methionine-rich copper-binding protein CopC